MNRPCTFWIGRVKRRFWRVPCRRLVFFFPVWSPDGKRLGLGNYFLNPDLEYGFWFFDPEKKQFQKMASGPYTMPAWSPDGSKMAVDYRGGDRTEVWVLETKNLDRVK
jgi:Tol biopolymer transport system component